MNLSTEQAQHVRERHAAGDAVIGLAVAGDWPKACPLADPTECNGEHCDCSLNPPADWVALTGVCETCGGRRVIHHKERAWPGRVQQTRCPDCIDGRKRATFTVWKLADVEDPGVPFAVATVEVVPVVSVATTPHPITDKHICLDRAGRMRGAAKYLRLDRQPESGRDFVALLTGTVLA